MATFIVDPTDAQSRVDAAFVARRKGGVTCRI
jgi:hypothetical protein